jgi:hypothetical protein
MCILLTEPDRVSMNCGCIGRNSLVTKVETLVLTLLLYNAASASGMANLIISLKSGVISVDKPHDRSFPMRWQYFVVCPNRRQKPAATTTGLGLSALTLGHLLYCIKDCVLSGLNVITYAYCALVRNFLEDIAVRMSHVCDMEGE